jgi:hypothetical protein
MKIFRAQNTWSATHPLTDFDGAEEIATTVSDKTLKPSSNRRAAF